MAMGSDKNKTEGRGRQDKVGETGQSVDVCIVVPFGDNSYCVGLPFPEIKKGRASFPPLPTNNLSFDAYPPHRKCANLNSRRGRHILSWEIMLEESRRERFYAMDRDGGSGCGLSLSGY